MTALWTRGHGYGDGANVGHSDGFGGGNGFGSGNGLGNGYGDGANVGYGDGFSDGYGVGDGCGCGDNYPEVDLPVDSFDFGPHDSDGYPEQNLHKTPVVCRAMICEPTLALPDLLILALAS